MPTPDQPSRSGEDNQSPGPTQTSSDRLRPETAGSLLSVRIRIGRRLLEHEPGEGLQDKILTVAALVNDNDEQILDAVNQMLAQARQPGATAEQQETAAWLWQEESQEWAIWHGGQGALSDEALLLAYQQAWTLAISPPQAPAFKTREELAKIRWESLTATERHAYMQPQPMDSLGSMGSVTPSIRNDPEVIRRYFAQFQHYLGQELPQFCLAKAIANAEQAGLPRLAMQQKIHQVITIKSISWLTFWPGVHARGLQARSASYPMPRSALLFAMPNDQFACITPQGELKRLQGPVFDSQGRLLKSAVLRAFDIAYLAVDSPAIAQANQCDINPSPRCARHLANFTIVSDVVDLQEPGLLTIEQLLISQIEKSTRAAILAWRQDNSSASVLESVLKAIVPFADAMFNNAFDPDYTFRIEDEIGSFIQLGLTLASIGLGAMSLGGLKVAIRVAWSMRHSNRIRLLCAVTNALKNQPTLSTFILLAGRELTDFVLPVFSTKQLITSLLPARRLAMRNTLLSVLRASDAALTDIGQYGGERLLALLYTRLEKTCSLGRGWTAQAIRRHIDEGASRAIPDTLYRAHINLPNAQDLAIAPSNSLTVNVDNYMASCLQHSARTGGSTGMVLSLSTELSVARRFAGNRPTSKVFIINTRPEPQNFRTIEHIIKHDGPQLVRQKKITVGTLGSAIRQAAVQEEREVFYMLGSIPAALLSH